MLFPVPVSKATITKMDNVISNHISLYDWPAWRDTMEPFWTGDMIYDSVYGLGKFVGLHDWFNGEHVPFNRAFDQVHFNQLLFLGDNDTASTTTYALARWYGSLAGMQPSGELVRIRICDFYRMAGDRIAYNWMMLDLPDILRQAGRRVLPEAALRDDGWFQPPRAMDGVPAPYSPLTPPEVGAASRQVAVALLDREWFEHGLDRGEAALWSSDMIFYGPSGIGFAASLQEYQQHVLGVIRHGFSHRSFSLDVLTCEGAYCAAHGYLRGVHSGCFMGEFGTNRTVQLRVALHWHIVGGVAVEGYAMFDTPALFKELGVDVLSRKSAPPPCPEPSVEPVVVPPKSFDNECLLRGPDSLQPPTKDALATFLADCPAWVVRTTDAVWSPGRPAADVNASLEAYFYHNFSSTSTFGKVYQGMDQLKEMVWAQKKAFPDLKIHVNDVFCIGNDVDGYKTVMPDVLTGTHSGPSKFGPPSGKPFAYSGIAVTYVQRVGGRWQYIAEVVNHDEWALMVQLGVANLSAVPHPDTVAQPHDCHTNRPTWGWQPPSWPAASSIVV